MAVPLISNDTPFVTSTEVSSSQTPVGDAVALVSAVSVAGLTVSSMPCESARTGGREVGIRGSGGGRDQGLHAGEGGDVCAGNAWRCGESNSAAVSLKKQDAMPSHANITQAALCIMSCRTYVSWVCNVLNHTVGTSVGPVASQS